MLKLGYIQSKYFSISFILVALLVSNGKNTFASSEVPLPGGSEGFSSALFKKTGKRNIPERIFSKKLSLLKVSNRNSGILKTTDTPVTITMQDLQNAYSVENDLEFYNSPEDSSYEMDIGSKDLVNPQHWIMPEGLIKEEKPGVGIEVSDSPFTDNFPEATHCKRYNYEGEEDYYEYYTINEEQVNLIGIGVNYIEDNEIEIDTTDYLMALLDLGINTAFEMSETLVQKNWEVVTNQKIEPYGFGTLTTPDGDVEVLVYMNTCYFKITSQDSVKKDETEIVLTFVDKNGTRFDIGIEQDAPTSGETDIDWMEYTHIVFNSTDIKKETTLPAGFTLEQNYPNPFNPKTNIRYELKESGYVTLAVYDELGKEISVLVNGEQSSGNHEVQYDGSSLSSGVYYYRLTQNNQSVTKKLMLMK